MLTDKISITKKQAIQFNVMLAALKKIHKDYQTPDQLRKNSKKQYGIGYEEALEMSYENLQTEARSGCFGVRPLLLNQ